MALAGCGGAQVSIDDELKHPDSLASCATGDVQASLAIISDLRDSYHEMIVCGGLQLDFSSALVNVIANAALGHGGPAALHYRGNGLFETDNHVMALQLGLADGGALDFDPMDPRSYLAGLSVSADANATLGAAMHGGSVWQVLGRTASTLDVQFQSTGPAFRLLGMTLAEARRGHLDLAKIAHAIAAQFTIGNRIDVQNEQGGTTIHYVLQGSPVPLSDVEDGKKVPMQLSTIIAERPTTGQHITVTEWTMQFKGDGNKVLDGTIGMNVDGGAFPYAARFTYHHSMLPDVELRCR
jgi:hypothetical protein